MVGNTSCNSSSVMSGAATGGFLVCLNVPPATEFGIHFVLFRSREQEHGIRQGFFVDVKYHSQVLVREWNLEKEELGFPRRELNVKSLEQAVLSFQLDSGLGPYPRHHLKTWQRLSNYISASVLQRCGVEFGAIFLPEDAVEDAGITDETRSGVIPYFSDLPRTMRFTALQRLRTDLVAAARTAYYFDRSERLEELIEKEFGGDWKEVLGELQVSYLVFLQLSSLAAFKQWKEFIALMCSCERAIASRVPLFLAFIKLLRVQLEQIPEDFFHDEMSRENFLSPCLLSLLELVENNDAPPQLRKKAVDLRQLLASRFHWNTNAELELDELAPVVVPEVEQSGQDKIGTTTSLSASLSASRAELHRLQEEERINAAIAVAFLRKDK